MPFVPTLTQSYLDNLISLLKDCHAEKADEYLEKIARDINVDKCREELTFLSDAIFYLEMFTIGTHEDKYAYLLKDKAMFICDFSEQDLLAIVIENPILAEDGTVMVTETGLEYIQQE